MTTWGRWYRPVMVGLTVLGLVLALDVAHIAAGDRFAYVA